MTLLRIGVSLGDPGGIGPEIVLKVLSRPELVPPARYVLFGQKALLESEARALGLEPFWKDARPGAPGVSLAEVDAPAIGEKRSAPSADQGLASFRFFEAAVGAARRGEISALVTAPVSKESWGLAGVGFRGHTEYLESLYPDAVMTFWSERLTVALLSHHLPLAEAVRRVRRENLGRLFRILGESLDRVRPQGYEFLVAGLNPHAGEGGLLGTEENEEIAPAIEAARRSGLRIRGPLPPDTIFREAVGRPESVVVALYHDQGLIPFKLEAFETGVNVTLGLPFIRTSPDHGTAFDIAGKNAADPRSMIEAVRLAAALAAGPF
jgi:4-hydroxythreonine-4-phosphate dehydrogenase